MKTEIIKDDIEVYCVTATSFPKGVKGAHEKLHSLVPFSPNRKYFGISYPAGKGNVIYKAAAEELNAGELSRHGLEKFVIRKGNYFVIEIKDFMKNIPAIGQAFQEILSDSRIDPHGVCVEWYYNAVDVKCMVRIADELKK